MSEPAAGSTPVGPSRGSWLTARRRRLLAILALPLVLAGAAATLTALQLNGSSIAILSSTWRDDPDLIAGTPRAVRSDEFLIATPVEVGNAAKGSPTHAQIGLTNTDLDVTSLGAGIRGWTAVFQPQTWPLLALPIGIGFAARWWFMMFAGILGVYALLMALRPRLVVAVPVAVVIGLSPLTAWWSSPSPSLILGFLGGAGAALVLANRASSRARTVALGLLAGYLACAGFFVLYPPWQISVGLVVAAVVIGHAIERRTRLLTFLTSAGTAVAVLVVSVGGWATQSSSSLALVTGTNYPGHRVAPAGAGDAAVLFGAPLNRVIAESPGRLAPGPLANQSEVSAPWFPLPVLVAFALLVLIGFLWRWRASRTDFVDSAVEATGTGRDSRATLIDPASGWRDWAAPLAVSAAMALLLAWMFVPFPDVVGRVTLFDRVPGIRTTLAVGFAAALLVHLCAGRLDLRGRVGAWCLVAVSVLLCVPLVLWSAARLLTSDHSGVPWAVVVALVVAGCVALLMFGRANAAVAALLLVVVVANWAIVNPLYRGLGPLTGGPLASTLRQTAAEEGPSRWVALGGRGVTQVIAASPNEVLSGVTFYPTPEVWERLAPTQRSLWNNYAKFEWIDDPTVKPAFIRQVHGTLMELRIDLCSPQVRFLDIRYVVTVRGKPVPSCYRPVKNVKALGQRWMVSRRE